MDDSLWGRRIFLSFFTYLFRFILSFWNLFTWEKSLWSWIWRYNCLLWKQWLRQKHLVEYHCRETQVKQAYRLYKTYFFNPYIAKCEYDLNLYDPVKLRDFNRVSRIITSDDVFNHIIDARRKNENLGFKRDLIFEEKTKMNRYGTNRSKRRVSVCQYGWPW